MSKFSAVILAMGLALCSVSVADAAGGCGVGWHRGPHDHCIRNWVHPAAHACARGWHLNRFGHCVRSW